MQLDEPAFTADRTSAELEALDRAYQRLGGLPERPKLLVTGYYGDLGPAIEVLAGTPVEAIGGGSGVRAGHADRDRARAA